MTPARKSRMISVRLRAAMAGIAGSAAALAFWLVASTAFAGAPNLAPVTVAFGLATSIAFLVCQTASQDDESAQVSSTYDLLRRSSSIARRSLRRFLRGLLPYLLPAILAGVTVHIYAEEGRVRLPYLYNFSQASVAFGAILLAGAVIVVSLLLLPRSTESSFAALLGFHLDHTEGPPRV